MHHIQRESVLENQLRQLEVSRSQTADSERITFVSGQTITRTRLPIDYTPELAALSGAVQGFIIETRIVDTRGSSVQVESPLQSFADSSGPKLGYPELDRLISPLDEVCAVDQVFDEPPSFNEIRAVLAGNGNCNPVEIVLPEVADACLDATAQSKLPSPAVAAFSKFMHGDDSVPLASFLKPEYASEFEKSAAHPFKEQMCFNMGKLRGKYEVAGLLIEPNEITPKLDAFVVCVGPDSLLAMGDKAELPHALRWRIFNPRMLAETPKRPYEPTVPVVENTLYEIRTFFNKNDSAPSVSLSQHLYSDSGFNCVDAMELLTIEKERGVSGFYFTIARSDLEVLATLAKLPVENSDCGRSLGYPHLNQQYEDLHARARASKSSPSWDVSLPALPATQ